MAILSIAQIIKLIEKPLASPLIGEAIELQDKHRLHIIGDGFKEMMSQTHGIESSQQFNVRKQVSSPTTVRIFKQILNQFKKALRADGFIREYQFKNNNTDLNTDFVNYLRDVSGGLNIKELMNIVWFKAVFENFNGVFIVDLPEEQTSKFAEPFVKFKGLENIHDIFIKGESVEYIIFTWITRDKTKRKISHFRVIDDAFDYHFIQEGADADIKINVRLDGTDDIIPNIWGYVPVIQPSTLFASLTNDFQKLSYITQGIHNADNYLRISNNHSVSVILHQHPIFYSFPVTCPTCNGKEHVPCGDNNDTCECNTCFGQGQVPFYKKDTAEGITLPEPDENQPFKAEAPCGYVTPDISTLNEQRIEMKSEELMIEKGILGVEGILAFEKKQQTATGRELDMQPLVDLLSEFSRNGEIVEKFLTDTIAIARYNDILNDTGQLFESSTIKWGRKYLVKSVDTIEKEFKSAKDAGLPTSTLNQILLQIISTKFDNDKKGFTRALLLFNIEPFPIYTIQELNDLGIATQTDLTIKLYFNDFIERFELESGDIILFMASSSKQSKIEAIKDKLVEFASEKIIKPVEQAKDNSQLIMDVTEKLEKGAINVKAAKMTLTSAGVDDEQINKILI